MIRLHNFYELPLHMKIITLQTGGLTLREAAIYLDRDKAIINASILAWLREN